MENHFIYGLIDPRNGQIRYIGKTNNPATRYTYHVGHIYGQNFRERWLRSLREAGYKPEMIILEEVPKTEGIQAENFWIGYFKMLGAKLVNSPKGFTHRWAKTKVSALTV